MSGLITLMRIIHGNVLDMTNLNSTVPSDLSSSIQMELLLNYMYGTENQHF